MANVMNVSSAQEIINELEKAHYHIERNANPKILFLDVSLQIVKLLNLTIRQKADTWYTDNYGMWKLLNRRRMLSCGLQK